MDADKYISLKSDSKYRVLELYSGIGGMRYALMATGVPFEVIAAIDLNPYVNKIYQHNFGSTGHFQNNILSLTPQAIDKMKVDIVTMSPPCQPFTRVGLKKDNTDPRCCSFLHFIKMLTLLQIKPKYLILENVQGFEESVTRSTFIKQLQQAGYNYQEFLLTPLDFGIPNSRTRYYLIARCEGPKFSFPVQEQILTYSPDVFKIFKYKCEKCLKSSESESCFVEHFLEDKPDEYFSTYMLSRTVLAKFWTVLDIINKNNKISCCFTKGYYHYAQGTGSVLVSSLKQKVPDIFDDIKHFSSSEAKLQILEQLKLRYFTPREIANLLCFPKEFGFPEDVSLKQMYKSLGNSLNVHVTSVLIKLLLDF